MQCRVLEREKQTSFLVLGVLLTYTQYTEYFKKFNAAQGLKTLALQVLKKNSKESTFSYIYTLAHILDFLVHVPVMYQ